LLRGRQESEANKIVGAGPCSYSFEWPCSDGGAAGAAGTAADDLCWIQVKRTLTFRCNRGHIAMSCARKPVDRFHDAFFWPGFRDRRDCELIGDLGASCIEAWRS